MIKIKNRILITGAGGYIGSSLCHKLLASGSNLNVLDKNIFNNRGLRQILNHPRIKLFEGDIRDVSIVSKAFDGVRNVIHLAGISDGRMGREAPVLTREINIKAMETIVMLSRSRDVNRFLFASTFGVYGTRYNVILSEELKPVPEEVYSESKVMGEELLFRSKSDSFCPVSLRIAMVYGVSPTMRYDFLISQMVRHALKTGQLTVYGGSQKRPQIHVQDLVRCIMTVMESDRELISGQIFNVVGQNPTVLEIAEAIQKAIPVKIELRSQYENESSFEMTGEKIKNSIGFVPEYSLAQGIDETILDILSNSEMQQEGLKI